jgi:phospholipase D1/2
LDHPVKTSRFGRLAQAERVAFLVDAAAYYEAFAKAAENAQRSIYILSWDINGLIRLQRDRPSESLREFFHRILTHQPTLQIYILNWDFPLVYAPNRELLPLFDQRWHTHPRLHFAWDSKYPIAACHHQKIVVIDDRLAFVGGLDLTDERWDMPSHLGKDRRRRGLDQEPYQPFHDATMMVEGPIAAELGELARTRWRRSGRTNGISFEEAYPHPGPSLWPSSVSAEMENVEVLMARTEPAYDDRPEVREIEYLYEDVLRRAKRYIYIENQYFTSRVISEAIARRLQEIDGPEVILVLPQGCTGWMEKVTLGVLRSRTLRYLKSCDPFGHLHAYYPTVKGLEKGTYIKVHSKVLIADDDFLKIGSANLCNRSMGLDTECDLAIDLRDQGQQWEVITRFRNRLLAEHLGTAPERVNDLIVKNGTLAAAIEEGGHAARRLVPFKGEISGFWDAIIPNTWLLDPDRSWESERRLRQELYLQGQRREARRLLRQILPFWIVNAAAFPLWGLWLLHKRFIRKILLWH